MNFFQQKSINLYFQPTEPLSSSEILSHDNKRVFEKMYTHTHKGRRKLTIILVALAIPIVPLTIPKSEKSFSSQKVTPEQTDGSQDLIITRHWSNRRDRANGRISETLGKAAQGSSSLGRVRLPNIQSSSNAVCRRHGAEIHVKLCGTIHNRLSRLDFLLR